MVAAHIGLTLIPPYGSHNTALERSSCHCAYRANLEDTIESNRGIIYKYLMRVYSVPGNELQLCITAERNEFALPGVSEPDAYFLRLYTGHKQTNLGSSPDWADIAKFESRALAIVREQLAVPDPVSTDQHIDQ